MTDPTFTVNAEPSAELLQAELDKAQIMLAYVLNAVGDVTIPLTASLPEGAAIQVDEQEDNTLIIRLVTE